MPKWTVIGYYEDNDQAWADSFEADTWEDAQRMAHEEHSGPDENGDGWPVIVTGVVEGEHKVFGGDWPDGR